MSGCCNKTAKRIFEKLDKWKFTDGKHYFLRKFNYEEIKFESLKESNDAD